MSCKDPMIKCNLLLGYVSYNLIGQLMILNHQNRVEGSKLRDSREILYICTTHISLGCHSIEVGC